MGNMAGQSGKRTPTLVLQTGVYKGILYPVGINVTDSELEKAVSHDTGSRAFLHVHA